MRLYSIWAILKVILGLGILYTIYHYVNVYEDPFIWLSLGFLGVFIAIRGVSYFFFLFCYKVFSAQSGAKRHSQSYTHSLLLGLRVMLNLTLMITNHRSGRLAFLLILVFLFFHRVVVYEPKEHKIPAQRNG